MMQKNPKKIPILRFPTFGGEWVAKPLKEIVKINQGLQIAISERFTEKIENAYFYITNEFLKENAEKQYFIKNPPLSVLCTKEDILMTRTGNTGMVVTNVEGVFHNNFFKVAYPDYISKNFLYYFLKLAKTQHQILVMAGTSTIPDLNHSDFYKITCPFPSFMEQQKIATFFAAIDARLAQLLQRQRLLKTYKKGVMQQLFAQELRFKQADGSDFEDWKIMKLGDCLNYTQPTPYLVSNTDYDNSYKTPVLTAGKTFILGYTNEEKGIFRENLPVILFDDFTTATQFVDFPFKAKSSAMKLLTAKKNIDIKFMFEAIQMIKYEMGGHERHWISKFVFMEILIPCLEEQTLMATYLTAIDAKIQAVRRQVVQTEQWKKGLLQQMFL